MSFRRILLKNASGIPAMSLTVSDLRPCIDMPKGTTALLILTDEITAPTDQTHIPFPAGGDISLLARKEGELLFGSTLPSEKASFAKWRLLSALEEWGKSPAKSPTESLEEKEELEINDPIDLDTTPKQEIAEEPTETVEEKASLEESVATESEAAPNKTERAEALLQKGTPFTLFDSVMPGSRWAIIKEDAAEYLIGITAAEDGGRILLGIPGARDFPPDEGRLWSFFPTEESEEMGYFLTEATEI